MFRRDTPKRRGADASIPLRHGCGSWCRLPPVASCFGLGLTARGPELLSLMDTQRLSICGRIVEPDDPSLQDALAAVYETPERPALPVRALRRRDARLVYVVRVGRPTALQGRLPSRPVRLGRQIGPRTRRRQADREAGSPGAGGLPQAVASRLDRSRDRTRQAPDGPMGLGVPASPVDGSADWAIGPEIRAQALRSVLPRRSPCRPRVLMRMTAAATHAPRGQLNARCAATAKYSIHRESGLPL